MYLEYRTIPILLTGMGMLLVFLSNPTSDFRGLLVGIYHVSSNSLHVTTSAVPTPCNIPKYHTSAMRITIAVSAGHRCGRAAG